ncbi:peptidylprolyl isomerase [Mangrovimonas aestuarii]|uniref:peptidylprolyl isomerase n=1 Tax=Mangrovimonas aestuarii TaxID=3018443 RepID=UPI002379AECA|nr:peptidylprolyl isomerase [Mangrovimonas aestuarii]
MKKIFKEPLFHFMLLGATIFAVYFLFSPNENNENQIVIDDNKLEHINALWELQWKRQPTDEEMQHLVENYIKQEVLYREALRMNLDHNDEIVKRRLSQKMEFMTSDLTKMMAPVTDENLQKYYTENKEKFRVNCQYSFNHELFTSSFHEAPFNKAQEVLNKNEKSAVKNIKGKGDNVSIPLNFTNASEHDIIRNLGTDFYNSLEDLPTNEWAGPITSGFGEHLVFISAKTPAYIPALKEIRDVVKRDYEYAIESKNKELIYKELKKNYDIIIKSENFKDFDKGKLFATLNQNNESK